LKQIIEQKEISELKRIDEVAELKKQIKNLKFSLSEKEE